MAANDPLIVADSRCHQEQTVILAAKPADTSRFMAIVRPSEVPAFINPPSNVAGKPLAQCSAMPPAIARACGFDQLSDEQRARLLVNVEAASCYTIGQCSAGTP